MDYYTCFLHARNVSERLLRASTADDNSFRQKYQFEEAIAQFKMLATDLGYDLVKREAVKVEEAA